MPKIFSYADMAENRGAILTHWVIAYEYKGDVRTEKQIGIKYDIVFPASGYRVARITVPAIQPICSNEELAESMKVTDVFVEFDNLQMHWYKDRQKNEWKLVGTADAIRFQPYNP